MRTAVDDVAALLPSFERSLKARNRSPKTIRGYVESARLFSAFLGDNGMPQSVGTIHREHVEAFIADQVCLAEIGAPGRIGVRTRLCRGGVWP